MRSGFLPAAVTVALAGVWMGASEVRAQEAPMAAQMQALDIFFKLGLPDSRGAKWVKARLLDGNDSGLLLPGGDQETAYSGNAWLVREEKNGTVELILDHTRRVRARRAKSDDDETAGKLPLVQIQDADLEADLIRLAAALKPAAFKGGSVQAGGEYLSGADARLAMEAGTILFCAHLQRQGRTKAIEALLPEALAFSPEPAAALDRAVSLLAEARLSQLTGEFLEKRDYAVYAQAIEKLAGEFPRGWARREAALLLARRVREQKPASAAAEAKKAAEMLASLNREQIESLRNSNWLLPAPGKSPPRGRSMGSFRGRRPAPSPEDGAEASLPAFFAQPRAGFAAVARLLDDHRLAALLRRDISGSGSSYFSSSMSPEERIQREYDRLDRPIELRELAWELIEKILPRDVRSEIEDLASGRGEKVLAWFQTIAPLSDDDLAWSILRQSEGRDDAAAAFGFLIEKGTAASQNLLQEVFLDPAVWSSGSMDSVLAQFETYAAKLGPAAAAFGEKVRPIVAEAIKAQSAERLANYGDSLNAEQRKMLERNAGGELKKFDQIFKPQGLAEMLTELAAADKADSMEIWQALQGQLEKTPWPEAETQLFRFAPKAKDATVRSGILSLIMQHAVSENETPKPGVVALDAETRAAIESLLADVTPLPQPSNWGASVRDFGDLAALALVLPRLSKDDSGKWQAVLGKIPEFSAGWIKSHARALVASQTPPPMPDAARVPAGRADEILKVAAALAPQEILPALLAKTPDEQAAVAAQLEKSTDWPPALLSARLTVGELQGDESEFGKEFNPGRWKGRLFNETMRQEITAALEKAALEGHSGMVGLSPVGLLGGLQLIFRGHPGNSGKINKQQLAQSKTPLLEGRPAPEALVSAYFMAQESGERKPPLIFAYALWKNPELSREWREKFTRSAEPGAKPAPEEREAARYRQQGFPSAMNDPAPLESAVRDLIADKPAGRGGFNLWWMARPIKETHDEDGEPEPPL